MEIPRKNSHQILFGESFFILRILQVFFVVIDHIVMAMRCYPPRIFPEWAHLSHLITFKQRLFQAACCWIGDSAILRLILTALAVITAK